MAVEMLETSMYNFFCCLKCESFFFCATELKEKQTRCHPFECSLHRTEKGRVNESVLTIRIAVYSWPDQFCRKNRVPFQSAKSATCTGRESKQHHLMQRPHVWIQTNNFTSSIHIIHYESFSSGKADLAWETTHMHISVLKPWKASLPKLLFDNQLRLSFAESLFVKELDSHSVLLATPDINHECGASACEPERAKQG